MSTDALTASIDLNHPAAQSFDLFISRFADWWPPEFSWSGSDRLREVGIEARLGGALYEIGDHGLRWDFGRVLTWEPPACLVFSWQIGPDRVPVPAAELASDVTVTFSEADGGRTTVAVEHGGWERHGADGAAYRESFAQVWPYVLARLAKLAAS